MSGCEHSGSLNVHLFLAEALCSVGAAAHEWHKEPVAHDDIHDVEYV